MQRSEAHRSINRGLQAITATDGETVISYSTAPKSTAQDGDGGHSPFAAALAQRLHTPGVEVGLLFRQVRQDVYDATGHRQDPFISANLGPEPFYFLPPSGAVTPPVNTGPSAWDIEQAVWNATKDCPDYQGYLTSYPTGAYAGLARARLNACQAPAGPAKPTEAEAKAAFNRGWEAGQKHDYVLAGASYETACAGGQSGACFNLGLLYEDGAGVPQGYGKARTLYEQACNGGNFAACDNLGVLYFNGSGVPQDYGKARTLYEQACNGGEFGGCNDLGGLYDNGAGVRQDHGKANELFKRSCDGGDALGCYYFGQNAETGLGVVKDTRQAQVYYAKACKLGNADACKKSKSK